VLYHLSRLVGRLIAPVPIFLIICAVVAYLHYRDRRPKLRRRLLIAGIAQLWLFSTGLTSDALLRPLESAYDAPSTLAPPPAAIVMLSGATSRSPVRQIEFNEAADRFTEAVRLAHRYPESLLVFTGAPEAGRLAELATELGVNRQRIRVDMDSWNTYKNAVKSQALLSGLRRQIVLITSASHMRRAMGCFRQALGFDPIPWPVDYRRHVFSVWSFLPTRVNLRRSEVALHEYLGLLVYSLAGYL
jgi:uncharacterized SAM-binding protein YcdF (DUF218 family)